MEVPFSAMYSALETVKTGNLIFSPRPSCSYNIVNGPSENVAGAYLRLDSGEEVLLQFRANGQLTMAISSHSANPSQISLQIHDSTAVFVRFLKLYQSA
jgi:hypothetical protein